MPTQMIQMIVFIIFCIICIGENVTETEGTRDGPMQVNHRGRGLALTTCIT